MSRALTLSGLPCPGVGGADREVAAASGPLASSSGSRPMEDLRTTAAAAANAPEIDIDRFRQGDPDTFKVVLKRFGSLIQSIVAAYRLQPDDREDLYQGICIRIWERSSQFSGRGSLLGWINAIAHNECRNYFAAHQRRQSRQTDLSPEIIAMDEIAGLFEDPLQLAARVQFMDHLRLSLAAMPPRQAQAFIVVRVLGFSAEEAAKMLGKAPATVRSNLRHARKQLRRSMGVYENGLS